MTDQQTYGIFDNLNLKLCDGDGIDDKDESVELIEHLNCQIRELKDESGRLCKLVSEKDFEIKQLKKANSTKSISAGVTNETAASKIVELSKRIRELTAELEGEKTRSKVLLRKYQELESQNVQSESTVSQQVPLGENSSVQKDILKVTQDRLHQSELKLAEIRNQNTVFKHELKLAQKVICQEIGDGVSLQTLVTQSVAGNWRGRAEQIHLLNSKISELKNMLDKQSKEGFSSNEDGSKSANSQKNTDKHRQQIQSIEKERREAQKRAEEKFNDLEKDYADEKQRHMAAKSRIKVLNDDIKTLKHQIETLMRKGQNDDELITALMKQQNSLKDLVSESRHSQETYSAQQSQRLLEMTAQKKQDDDVMEQMKSIISEKENRLLQLEQKLEQAESLRLIELQKEGLQAIFNINSTESDMYPPPQSVTTNTVSTNTSPTSRPVTRKSSVKSTTPSNRSRPITPQESEGHNADYIQCKALLQVSEIERDKMSELLRVQQKRIDEINSEAILTQNEIISLKRKNALLEKQLQKYNISSSNVGSKKGVSLQSPSNKTADELNASLLIQQDENDALKEALSCAVKDKEEDLRIYTEMMKKTREVFLSALQDHEVDNGH